MKLPVYKSTVIEYAMRLLSGTEFCLYFAIVKDDGGKLHYEWDLVRARRRVARGRRLGRRSAHHGRS